MALRAQIIDLVGPDLLHDRRQAGCIREIRVVEMKPLLDRTVASEQVIDSLTVQTAGTTNQAMNLVFGLIQEQVGQVRTILAGNSRDQCTFHGGYFPECSRTLRCDAVTEHSIPRVLRDDWLEGLEQLPGEIPQCVVLGIVFARVEDLNCHGRSARRLPVATSAGDGKLPHVVLQLPFSEYVVPKANVFDQFTLGVAQVGDQGRLSAIRGNRQLAGL